MLIIGQLEIAAACNNHYFVCVTLLQRTIYSMKSKLDISGAFNSLVYFFLLSRYDLVAII